MITRIHISIILLLTPLCSPAMELSVNSFQYIPCELHHLIAQNFDYTSDISALCQANTFFANIYHLKNALIEYPHLHAHLTQNQYLNGMVHYAQTDNYPLMKSFIYNEGRRNGQVRVAVLDFFQYPITAPGELYLYYTKHAFSGITNRKYSVNSTHCHLAVLKRNRFALAVLYKNGANINAPDAYRTTTPLAYAIKEKLHDFTKQLFSYGCTTNTVFFPGNTLLHVACIHNNKFALKLLLEKGHDVNAINAQGDTALHLATVWEDLSCTKLLLLQPHVNISIQNNDGETAFDLIYDSEVKKELLQLYHSAIRQQTANKKRKYGNTQQLPQAKKQRKK